MKYSSNWTIDKAIFWTNFKKYWKTIEKYRIISQYKIFQSRKTSQNQKSFFINDFNHWIKTFFRNFEFKINVERIIEKKKKYIVRIFSFIWQFWKKSSFEIQFESIKKRQNISANLFLSSNFIDFIKLIILKSSVFLNTFIMNAKISRMLKKIMNTIIQKTLTNFRNNQKSIDSQKSKKSKKSAKNLLTNKNVKQWNSENVKYFDFNYEKKFAIIERALTHAKKNIYYWNVHVFVEKIKKMTIILKTNQIRQSLSICFRYFFLMWHTTKFSNTIRRILIYENDVKKWMKFFLFVLNREFQSQSISFYIKNITWKTFKNIAN